MAAAHLTRRLAAIKGLRLWTKANLSTSTRVMGGGGIPDDLPIKVCTRTSLLNFELIYKWIYAVSLEYWVPYVLFGCLISLIKIAFCIWLCCN